MSHNSPKWIALFSLFLFAASCVLFYFSLGYIYANILTSETAYMEWEAETDKRTQIENLYQTMESIESEKKELESHFVTSRDIVPFLNKLESLASHAGTTAEIVGVEMGTADLTAELKTRGEFEAV